MDIRERPAQPRHGPLARQPRRQRRGQHPGRDLPPGQERHPRRQGEAHQQLQPSALRAHGRPVDETAHAVAADAPRLDKRRLGRPRRHQRARHRDGPPSLHLRRLGNRQCRQRAHRLQRHRHRHPLRRRQDRPVQGQRRGGRAAAHRHARQQALCRLGKGREGPVQHARRRSRRNREQLPHGHL